MNATGEHRLNCQTVFTRVLCRNGHIRQVVILGIVVGVHIEICSRQTLFDDDEFAHRRGHVSIGKHHLRTLQAHMQKLTATVRSLIGMTHMYSISQTASIRDESSPLPANNSAHISALGVRVSTNCVSG
jgi:hypothetical protein